MKMKMKIEDLKIFGYKNQFRLGPQVTSFSIVVLLV